MVAISDDELLGRYLPPAMEQYFARKLPELDGAERRRRVAECLKGLVLLQLCPGEILFSDAIDAIWHLWILQTVQYAELCQELGGGDFIHHSSKDYRTEAAQPTPPAGEGVADRVFGYFAMYVGKFGAIGRNRLDYWPPLAALMTSVEWDLAGLNTYLSQRASALDLALSQIWIPQETAPARRGSE